jgi:predicted RNA-binding Zn ribbon-like protein
MEMRTSLALDLVNSYDPYYAEPESLRTPADLARFLERWDVKVEGSLSDGDVRLARAVRDRLRAVFEAADAREAATLLNRLLHGASVRPYVAPGEAGAWSTELAVDPSTPPLERLAIEAALGLGATLQRYGLDRLRVCASDPCREAFIDTSRNASRRFCSDRCANRYNVAAYRERHRGR